MDANYTKPEEAITRYTNLNSSMQEIIDNLKKFMLTGKKEADTSW